MICFCHLELLTKNELFLTVADYLPPFFWHEEFYILELERSTRSSTWPLFVLDARWEINLATFCTTDFCCRCCRRGFKLFAGNMWMYSESIACVSISLIPEIEGPFLDGTKRLIWNSYWITSNHTIHNDIFFFARKFYTTLLTKYTPY